MGHRAETVRDFQRTNVFLFDIYGDDLDSRLVSGSRRFPSVGEEPDRGDELQQLAQFHQNIHDQEPSVVQSRFLEPLTFQQSINGATGENPADGGNDENEDIEPGQGKGKESGQATPGNVSRNRTEPGSNLKAQQTTNDEEVKTEDRNSHLISAPSSSSPLQFLGGDEVGKSRPPRARRASSQLIEKVLTRAKSTRFVKKMVPTFRNRHTCCSIIFRTCRL